MNGPAAIRAAFTNIRNVQGRKIVQLIFEIPIEQAESAFMTLGWPDAIEPKWCALAVLNEAAEKLNANQQESRR